MIDVAKLRKDATCGDFGKPDDSFPRAVVTACDELEALRKERDAAWKCFESVCAARDLFVAKFDALRAYLANCTCGGAK